MYRSGFNYLKAGVMLVHLQPEGLQQGELDLFTTDEESRAPAASRGTSQLMGTVDALNRRFGQGAVGIASATRPVGTQTHAGKQERRSPRYTTRADEIPIARA
jgi:DNA polymerase V